MKIHLTERAIKEVVVPEGRKYILVFDAEQVGFAVLKTAKGSLSYVVVYRDAEGKQRQEKLGKVGEISAVSARELAKSRMGMAQGLREGSTQSPRKALMPTFDEFFFNTFLPIVKANSRSFETHASIYRNHLQPVFGKFRLDEITERDILDFKSDLTKKVVAGGCWPSQSTRTLAEGTVKRIMILVRHIFNVAIRDKSNALRDNPTEGLVLVTTRKVKGVFLTVHQLKRLFSAAENFGEGMLDIIRVIAATGLRRENVLALEWSWLDLDSGALTVPDWADKAKKGFTVFLSDPVIDLLKLRHESDENGRWVFPNPKTGKPYSSRWSAWNSIRKAAGLERVRMHDLRHTYASMMLESGADIIDVQQALGHTQLKTTAVYLHLRDDRKRANANAAASAIGMC